MAEHPHAKDLVFHEAYEMPAYRGWRFINQPCGCRYYIVLVHGAQYPQAHTMTRCRINYYPAPPPETFAAILPPEELARYVAARMTGR